MSDSVEEHDELVSVLPIHFSDALAPNIHIHQFPLLNRPLQEPPSASLSGKRITARIKPQIRRLEIHVPVDVRSEVCNLEKSKELGRARADDDRERNQDKKEKAREDEEPRLSETRLKSEEIIHKGAPFLGIVRNGKLYLHPINETHQFRPTLTYLDILSRKNKRTRGAGSDSDSDDGPPPDPDEVPVVTQKKDKKATGEAKEVHVSARKSDDQGGFGGQGSMSAARREILHIIRVEEDEQWQSLEFCNVTSTQSSDTFESLLPEEDQVLQCKMNMTTFLKDIKGL